MKIISALIQITTLTVMTASYCLADDPSPPTDLKPGVKSCKAIADGTRYCYFKPTASGPYAIAAKGMVGTENDMGHGATGVMSLKFGEYIGAPTIKTEECKPNGHATSVNDNATAMKTMCSVVLVQNKLYYFYATIGMTPGKGTMTEDIEINAL